MAIIKRGKTYWYEFRFQGVHVRESSHSPVRAVCERLMRERRRKLELGMGGIKPIARPKLFSVAAKEWLSVGEATWSAGNRRIEGYNVDHLMPHFGKMLLADITADDVARYQAARKKEGASPRTVGMETGTLRAILRKARLWASIQPDVRVPKGREDVGRALSADEQHRLLTACKASRSRSLYPAFLISLHTGVRSGELRNLQWRNIDLMERTIRVGKSKTKAGEGRLIPLSKATFDCLCEWRKLFPNAEPAHYIFPSEKYGLDGEKGHKAGKAVPYAIDPTKPIKSWKEAWTTARETAKVQCRWHDGRHSFVSALAEGQASDSTIMALAGHVSKKMMERYSHTRNERKREAIAAVFDKPTAKEPEAEGQADGENATGPAASYQNPPQPNGESAASLM